MKERNFSKYFDLFLLIYIANSFELFFFKLIQNKSKLKNCRSKLFVLIVYHQRDNDKRYCKIQI